MDVMALSTGNPRLDHWIGLIGTFVTIASFVAGSLNQRIRSSIDTEGEAPRFFLYAGLVLNYCAINLDKAAQMHKLLRGQPIQKTDPPKPPVQP